MKVGVIDYGGGNLRSVVNALRSLEVDPVVVASEGDAAGCTHMILPGQGAFGDTMNRLAGRGLVGFLKQWMAEDRPYFGICVGYQILFDRSEESPDVEGLGVFAGSVRRFDAEPGLKIPHMGWNAAVSAGNTGGVWKNLGAEPYFYYVHSYFPVPADESVVVARTTYGTQTFAGAVERGRVFACQFHPEKSQNAGLRLISNFLEA